jgi:hypothetical protein
LKNKENKALIILALSIFISIIIPFIITIVAICNRSEKQEEWILRQTVTDEFGYGETAIGTSGLYMWQTRDLYDAYGLENGYGHNTDWEVTIVVDSATNTEYLIFKDKTTGNITAVERKKYEETVPEEEKMYLAE